jgi:hypothetical protein
MRNINANNRKLFWALSAQVGNLDCIQCLLILGAKVDARDKKEKWLFSFK